MSVLNPAVTASGPPAWATRLLRGLAWTLLVAGSVRMLLLVLHRPVLGYADNYDFVRMYAGFDLWPADAARGYGSPPAPLRRLAFAHFGRDGSLYSSEMLLIGPAVGLMRVVNWVAPGTLFDLRAIGFCQALVLILISAHYCRRFLAAGQLAAALLLSLAFALLVADPINTLYLNTLYTDTAAWVFAWFAVLASAHLLLEGMSAGRLAVWAVALVLLGTSKVQHVATALALGGSLLGATWIAGRKFPRRLTIALGGAGVAMLAVTWVNFSRPDGYLVNLARCNITNTVLGGILPLSKHPQQALATLGLPPTAAPFIGKSAYEIPSPHPCPELFNVSRTRLLRLFWREPRLVGRMVRKGLVVIGAEPGGLRYSSVGCVEDTAFAVAPNWSLNRLYQPLSPRQRRAVVLLPLLLMVYYAFRALMTPCSPCERGAGGEAASGGSTLPILATIVAACCVAGYASLALTILGDGYSDYVRHNHVALNLLLAVNLLAAGHLAWSVAGRWMATPAMVPTSQRQSGRGRMVLVGASLAVLFVVANVMCVLTLHEPPGWTWDATKIWREGAPCGRVEGSVPNPGDHVRVFGWAYDAPHKAYARQMVVVCDGHALPIPVFRGLPRPDIARAIGLPQLETCGWETVVPRRLAPDGSRLEVYAVLQDGSFGRLEGP
jgi:hypothetical protein